MERLVFQRRRWLDSKDSASIHPRVSSSPCDSGKLELLLLPTVCWHVAAPVFRQPWFLRVCSRRSLARRVRKDVDEPLTISWRNGTTLGDRTNRITCWTDYIMAYSDIPEENFRFFRYFSRIRKCWSQATRIDRLHRGSYRDCASNFYNRAEGVEGGRMCEWKIWIVCVLIFILIYRSGTRVNLYIHILFRAIINWCRTE